jgi:hypothetical protein
LLNWSRSENEESDDIASGAAQSRRIGSRVRADEVSDLRDQISDLQGQLDALEADHAQEAQNQAYHDAWAHKDCGRGWFHHGHRKGH